MAVREFNGTSDDVIHSAGGLSAATFGTVAAIFKTDVSGVASEGHALAYDHDSGGSWIGTTLMMYEDDLAVWLGGRSDTSGTISPGIATGTWYLAVMRKATGTATPRFSRYNFTAGTWAHGDGSTAQGDWTALGASGTIRMGFQSSSEFWDGRLAVRAQWANEVHWSADGTGDTAIEAAGLEDSLQNWVDEAPDALWPFNQDPLSAVDDIVGTSNQSSVSGTTVVTGDDPPGFSFTLGDGVVRMPRGVIVAG